MINKIKISNYKSLNELEIEPGRLNVIIGENGCGKSNFLEAVTLAGAAISEKLDNEFLANRGIRVTTPALMRSNFPGCNTSDPIEVAITDSNGSVIKFGLMNDNKPYSTWTSEITDSQLESLRDDFSIALRESIVKELYDSYFILTSEEKKDNKLNIEKLKNSAQQAVEKVFKDIKVNDIKIDKIATNFKVSINKKSDYFFSNFMIFSPENSSLRNFYEEGQVEPLGINGQGLLKLIHVISTTNHNAYIDIIESLKLFSWFKDIKIPEEFDENNDNLTIHDKFIESKIDQRSANEGFLFVLFYVALVVSSDTPAIFAIDNIDTSLNPKLCIKLTKLLSELAKKYNKQLFITTHNPAVLDGLDLNDDMQRLFVFNRNRHGHTKVKRITAENRPKSSTTKDYLNLSESMMRGYLKALPTNF